MKPLKPSWVTSHEVKTKRPFNTNKKKQPKPKRLQRTSAHALSGDLTDHVACDVSEGLQVPTGDDNHD